MKNQKTTCKDCGVATTPGAGSARCPSCWDDKVGRDSHEIPTNNDPVLPEKDTNREAPPNSPNEVEELVNKITINDVIREFERANFRHVNMDYHAPKNFDYQAAVVELAVRYTKLRSLESPLSSSPNGVIGAAEQYADRDWARKVGSFVNPAWQRDYDTFVAGAEYVLSQKPKITNDAPAESPPPGPTNEWEEKEQLRRALRHFDECTPTAPNQYTDDCDKVIVCARGLLEAMDAGPKANREAPSLVVPNEAENKKMKLLERATDLLRSTYHVAEREGKATNWSAMKAQINDLLTGLYLAQPINLTPSPESPSNSLLNEVDVRDLKSDARDEAEGLSHIRGQGATYTFVDGAQWALIYLRRLEAERKNDTAPINQPTESPPHTSLNVEGELKIMDFQNEAYQRAKSREGAESGAGVWDFMAGHDWTVARMMERNSTAPIKVTTESLNTKLLEPEAYRSSTYHEGSQERRLAERIEQLERENAELKKELEEQCRLHGMGASREHKLMTENAALKANSITEIPEIKRKHPGKEVTFTLMKEPNGFAVVYDATTISWFAPGTYHMIEKAAFEQLQRESADLKIELEKLKGN